MLSNYIKIAWRNLLRNKVFSFINITGLALGMATCLTNQSVRVPDELSFDRFHDKADRIVRVTFRANMNGNEINEAHRDAANCQKPTARLSRSTGSNPVAPRHGELLADQRKRPGFKKLPLPLPMPISSKFSAFPLVNGDPKTALLRPNTLVISDKMARKYFGDANPIGKTLVPKGTKQALTGNRRYGRFSGQFAPSLRFPDFDGGFGRS